MNIEEFVEMVSGEAYIICTKSLARIMGGGYRTLIMSVETPTMINKRNKHE